MTGCLYSLILLAKLMVLRLQMLFSLAIAAIAEAILTRTSAEQVSSLHRVAPMQVLGTGHLLYFLAVHCNICTDAVRAVGHDLAFSVLTSSHMPLLCLRVCW